MVAICFPIVMAISLAFLSGLSFWQWTVSYITSCDQTKTTDSYHILRTVNFWVSWKDKSNLKWNSFRSCSIRNRNINMLVKLCSSSMYTTGCDKASYWQCSHSTRSYILHLSVLNSLTCLSTVVLVHIKTETSLTGTSIRSISVWANLTTTISILFTFINIWSKWTKFYFSHDIETYYYICSHTIATKIVTV